MNDSAYTYDISTKLIDMAEILFVAREQDLRAEERGMALTDEELEAIVRDIEADEEAEEDAEINLLKTL